MTKFKFLFCLFCFSLFLFFPLKVSAEGNQTDEIIISFAGDCTLGVYKGQGTGNRIDEVYSENGPEYFFTNVKDVFENDDITFVNLEGPLTNENQKAIKTYSIKGNPEYVQALKKGSIESCSLANNHMLDCGDKGLLETENNLKAHGIGYAYLDSIDYQIVKNHKIAFLSFRGWEFDKILQNSIDNNIKIAKDNGAELIIVAYHWGEERIYQHNAVQEKIAHYTIDAGADFVVGTHPHVLQGIEKYNGKTILYSLGNFCFGANKNPKDKDTIIYQQTFNFKDNKLSYGKTNIFPCKISSVDNKNDYKPTIVTGDEAVRILDKFLNICK